MFKRRKIKALEAEVDTLRKQMKAVCESEAALRVREYAVTEQRRRAEEEQEKLIREKHELLRLLSESDSARIAEHCNKVCSLHMSDGFHSVDFCSSGERKESD